MINCPICLDLKAPSDFFSHKGEGHKHPFCRPCLLQQIRVSNQSHLINCPFCREPVSLKGVISLKDRFSLTHEETKIYLKAAAILGLSGFAVGALGGAAFAFLNEGFVIEDCALHGALYCSLSGIYSIILSRVFRD